MSRPAAVTSGLAALQRTHAVYRRARDLAEGGSSHSVEPADSTPAAPSKSRSPAAKPKAGTDLVASVQALRAQQAGQQVAAQHAAATIKELETSLRESQEQSAQHVAKIEEELKQERARRSKLADELKSCEMQLATSQQKLQTAAAAAKKNEGRLSSELVDATSTIEALELERDAALQQNSALKQRVVQLEGGVAGGVSGTRSTGVVEPAASAQQTERAEATAAQAVAEARRWEDAARLAEQAASDAEARGAAARIELEAHVQQLETLRLALDEQCQANLVMEARLEQLASSRKPTKGPVRSPTEAAVGAAAEVVRVDAASPNSQPVAAAEAAMGAHAEAAKDEAVAEEAAARQAKNDAKNAPDLDEPPRAWLRSKFPLLAAAASESNRFVLGGGGGASKTGVPNAISVCEISAGGERSGGSPVVRVCVCGGGEAVL